MPENFVGERLLSDEAATAVEYAIIVSLIAMVIVGAVAILGGSLLTSYDCDAQKLEGANQDPPASVDC